MAKRYSGTVTFDIIYSGAKAPPFSKGHSGIHTPSTGQYRVRVYHARKHVETFYYHEKPAIITKKGVDSPEMYDQIGEDAANSIVHSGPEGLVGHLHLNQNGHALVSRTQGGKRHAGGGRGYNIDEPKEIVITRERLDSGGYTSSGRYFGTGQKLWSWETDTGKYDWVRADSKQEAFEELSERFPHAKLVEELS